MNKIDKIELKIFELKRKLKVLNQGRKDGKGGDKFIQGHMVWLTD